MPSSQDFLDAIAAWLDFGKSGSNEKFVRHWVKSECTLLAFARQKQFRFTAYESAKFERLRVPAHHTNPADHYYLTPIGCARAAPQMQCLIHAVQAGRVWQSARDAGKEPPPTFADSVLECIRYYHQACPLTEETVPLETQICNFGDQDAPSSLRQSLLKVVLQDANRGTQITASAYFAAQSLLEYLLQKEIGRVDFKTNGKILLYDERAHSGKKAGYARDVEFALLKEAVPGFFLDPVALGMTVVDDGVIQSLQTAWAAQDFKDGLSARIGKDEFRTPLCVRLYPRTHRIKELTGQSAGLVFACGMCAAAHHQDLDPHVTASAMLDPDNPAKVLPVNPATLPAKLAAAAGDGMNRIVLEAAQATSFPGASPAPDIIGVSNLAHAWQAMTAKAAAERKMEEVLRAYGADVAADWSNLRKGVVNGEPDDSLGLTRYVEPYYGLLPEDLNPIYLKNQISRIPDEAGTHHDDRFERKSLADLLDETLKQSNRLCLMEDAGTGKSIFTRMVEAFLSQQAGWDILTDGKPCLAVRWERRWPDDVRGELMRQLEPYCDGDVTAEQVLRWAVRERRVVLILDALDQVPNTLAKLNTVIDFLESRDGRNCRVILTSRFFEVPRWKEHFCSPAWRFARIELFEEAQQVEYLKDLLDTFRDQPDDEATDPPSDIELLDRLIPHRREVADLLEIPVVLHLISGFAKSGQRLDFQHRGDVYLAATDMMLKRAISKSPELGVNFREEDAKALKQILAAAAFEMMRHEIYEYAVWGTDGVEKLRDAIAKRCSGLMTHGMWDMVLDATNLTERSILEVCTPDVLGWRHRSMMEFHCGQWLARYATDECVGQARNFANDDQWQWAWRFAMELPKDVVRPDVLAASLKVLYERPQQGTRPTELMYRAWEVLEQLDGGQAVLDAFREQFRQIREGESEDVEIARQLLPGGKHKRLKSKGKEDSQDEYIDIENFIQCPAGKFWMGATDDDKDAEEVERPRHQVLVSEFWLQTTTVTTAQYRLFDPARAGDWDADCPMTSVDWYDACMFARWIGGRLPTEAQWEYACRAGTETAYSFGDDEGQLGDYAWYADNSESQAHPVAIQKPNPWRLYDMHGNVCEWCDDWYQANWYQHQTNAARKPDEAVPWKSPPAGSSRVLRGGSWYSGTIYCRSTYRSDSAPVSRCFDVGFRLCVRSLCLRPSRPLSD